MKIFSRFNWLQWLLLILFALILTGTLGLAFGYFSGVQDRESNRSISQALDILQQFELGQADYEAGNYSLALQRFDYVVQQDPNFPGAVEMLSDTMLKISEQAVATVQIEESTSTPIPTPDTSLVDELYAQAESQFKNQEWKILAETVTTIRDADPLYRAKELDRMLFLALYFNGIDKILNQGNLEGGVYDFSLAERFAPLAAQGRIYQEWARLYQIGVSFWGVFPDKAVYYFSQLASTAPYLHDFSGIFAKDRYRLALLQYGDKLSQAGEWCLAVEQYRLAYGLQEDEGLQPTITFAEEQCKTGEAAPTLDPGLEITLTPGLTLTPTLEITPEITPTPGLEITPTVPPVEPTLAPTLEPTSTQAPIEPTPTPEPAP